MDTTLLIALAAATLSVVLFAVMVVVAVALGAVLWRARAARRQAAALAAEPPSSGRSASRAFDSLDPSTERPLRQPPPAAEPASNLIGFFDDETSSAAARFPGGGDLFKSGSQIPASAFNSVPPQRMDDEDGGDGEATEIFSASQLGSEFAEFLEEGEDASGRQPKERGAP